MRIPSSSGERQNFNVINDIGDTFHPFHDVPDLGPEVGLRYLADERDRAAVDRKSEVVEHAKVQKHHQLVPDLIWRFRSLARIGLRTDPDAREPFGCSWLFLPTAIAAEGASGAKATEQVGCQRADREKH
jgi:hypothetical protein